MTSSTRRGSSTSACTSETTQNAKNSSSPTASEATSGAASPSLSTTAWPRPTLEMDLMRTRYQRDKSAKIYEAIRESLPDIKFYETVTNLKLETTDGRLHVHVVEDGNEIINYARVGQVRHLGCRRIRERDIVFDSHMSGFVYRVCVNGYMLIKEIPSQDTIEEFLYKVNALNGLRYSRHVSFYGVVVDDHDQLVKGLLISYASQGALIDIIYDKCKENSYGIPWPSKEKWARQIVRGLADIHESGFVQGDFTLSNIVIDEAGDAKIIDINRRGCPVGWEPPEATALLDTGHHVTMYIGVKSDLYQLGMVLWGLAMEEDEPEAHGRPLVLGPAADVPDWYRRLTDTCLSADPRMRAQAPWLLQLLPPESVDDEERAASVDDGRPLIRTVDPPHHWPYSGRTYVDTSPVPYELYYPPRGRSPPSPLPSDFDLCCRWRDPLSKTSWATNRIVRPSYTDIGADETVPDASAQGDHEHETPTPTAGDEASWADGTPAAAALEDARASPTSPRPAREQTALSRGPWPELGTRGRSASDSGHVDQVTQQRSCARRDTGTQATQTHHGPRPSRHFQRPQPMQHGSEGAEREVEPEYVASQPPPQGTKDEVAPRDESDGEARLGWATDCAAPHSGAVDSFTPPGSKANQLATPGSDRPRHMTLPVSLAGVGAAHLDIDDKAMRDKDMLDDDLAMMQPATAPTLAMVTTDATP